MRVILQFDIPKEQEEFETAKKGWSYKRDREALMAILRQKIDDSTGDLRAALQDIYKEFLNEITTP